MPHRLEQVLRPVDPGSAQPPRWGRACLLPETPIQRAGAHRRPGGDVVEGKPPVGIVFHPAQERLEAGAVRTRLLVHDELGLPPSRSRGITASLAASAATAEP